MRTYKEIVQHCQDSITWPHPQPPIEISPEEFAVLKAGRMEQIEIDKAWASERRAHYLSIGVTNWPDVSDAWGQDESLLAAGVENYLIDNTPVIAAVETV